MADCQESNRRVVLIDRLFGLEYIISLLTLRKKEQKVYDSVRQE